MYAWQFTWVDSENGASLPVQLGWAVTLHESRFAEAPWAIPGKIIGFNPDHVWTAAPTDSEIPGTFDEEFEERPPNGHVVVKLYHPKQEHWLNRREYQQIVDTEEECPTREDPSGDDSCADHVSETSEEDS